MKKCDCGKCDCENKEVGKALPIIIEFSLNGQSETALAKPVDDAFYKIVSGKYAGNYVHVWDLKKK